MDKPGVPCCFPMEQRCSGLRHHTVEGKRYASNWASAMLRLPLRAA